MTICQFLEVLRGQSKVAHARFVRHPSDGWRRGYGYSESVGKLPGFLQVAVRFG